VIEVNQGNRSFTLHWEGGTNGEVGTRTYSYQCTFKATNATVYKSGSWSDVKVSAHVKIKGEGQTGHVDIR
jgi:hypothetical protein